MNGILNPDAKKCTSKDKLSHLHQEYLAAWLGDDNRHKARYTDLRQLCAAAESAKLRWNAGIPPADLPDAWVSIIFNGRPYT